MRFIWASALHVIFFTEVILSQLAQTTESRATMA
jgi:hypothetical protein